MISLHEIDRSFKYRIGQCLFIDELRSIEREMIGYYSQSEITALTLEKRRFIENNTRGKMGERHIDFSRTDIDGVIEKRAKFESFLTINGAIISLGIYKTKEKAHKMYLVAKENKDAFFDKERNVYEPEVRVEKFLSACIDSHLINNKIWRK